MHDQTWHAAIWEVPTHLIIEQSQLILSGLPWPMLTGLFWRMCLYVRVCKWRAHGWQGPRSEGAGCWSRMPNALSPPIDPLSPPPWCRTDWQTDPCYSTHTSVLNSHSLPLFLFILSHTLHTVTADIETLDRSAGSCLNLKKLLSLAILLFHCQ